MSVYTDPEQFKLFHQLLMTDSPEGFQPFYFPLEKNGKDPLKGGSWKNNRKTFSEAYNLLRKGFNIGIAATEHDSLVIVDIDDLAQVKDPKPTLMNVSRKRIGRHCFYFTDDNVARTIFDNSAKQNIATEEAGEVRSVWQYVVAAGSYVPCAPEELDRIPVDDKPNAGKYTVLAERSVTKITYEELPEAYRVCLQNKRAIDISNRQKKTNKPISQDKDSKNRSALWNLDIHDVTGKHDDATHRFPSPFHGSKTFKDTSVSNGMLHCWRHNCSHTALTYLAVEAGVSNCSGAGFGHNSTGSSDVDFNDSATVYKVWLHAKQRGYIQDSDPMPTKAMIYYAIQEKMCTEKDIIDGWKLPFDVYNKIIEIAPFNVGREPLKKKIEKIGESIKKAALDTMHIAEALQEEVPIYYDPWKNFWMWDNDCRCYKRIDETEILVQIAESMDLTLYRSNAKSELLEAIRITGRMRRVKPTEKTWIYFRDKVVNVDTNEVFDPSPDWFFSMPIPHKYGISDETPVIEKLFESWVGEKKSVLYEICAFCMLDDYPIHRLFALVGKGRNGKSVFMEFIRRLIGWENCVSTDLDRLVKTQFEASKLFKKKVAFISETNYSTLTRTNMLKAVTGDDMVSCEFKGKDSFDFKSSAKVIMATNGLPSTTDRTDGFYSRWTTLTFPNQFKEGKNPLDEIPESEYENMCYKCIKILKDLLNRGSFCFDGTIEERKNKYESLSNPVQNFVDSLCEIKEANFVPIFYLYEQYDIFREKGGHRKISKNEFMSIIRGMGFESGPKKYNSEMQGAYSDSINDEGVNWKSVFGLKIKEREIIQTTLTSNRGNQGNSDSISFSIYENQVKDRVTTVTELPDENVKELSELDRLDRKIINFVKEVYHLIAPDEFEFESNFCKENFVYRGTLVRERFLILKKNGFKGRIGG